MKSPSPSPESQPAPRASRAARRPPEPKGIAMADASVITGSPLSPARGRVNAGARFWPSAITVARRTVRKFVRTPQLIGLATVQSAIFLVIFRYIFGGAINAGGLPYVDFLVPGFVVTGCLWAGM